MSNRILFPGGEEPRSGRSDDANLKTIIGTIGIPPDPPLREELEALFLDHYSTLRDAALRTPRHGLLVAAIHGDRCRALGLEVPQGALKTVILGRHRQSDLVLDADPRISLRHLAILAGTRVSRASPKVRVRVVDLRTRLRFQDENGRRLEALSADGPLFLRVGSFALLLFPAPGASEWPEDAAQAWKGVPARHYLEAREARQRPSRARSRDDTQGTNVFTMKGPAEIGDLGIRQDAEAEATENPLGSLVLTSKNGSEQIEVDPDSASRGILLGRYGRCDSRHLLTLHNRFLSRVHLLILASEGKLWAVDTASTNHTLRDKEKIRITRLDEGARLMLPGGIHLEWQPHA